jgi:SAM-dependent methyltransferase
MDFGCGTGSATPYLFEYLGAESVLGLDISEQSLDKARARHGSARVRFLNLHAYEPCGEIDLVYCNGVFHHIPPPQRAGVVEFIYRALRPGGWFALWENNPWSPGARYVMSRIPFDRDAVMVWPREAERLLRGAGFRHPRTTFTFIFPRMLAGLRWLEPPLARLPLGAQYQVLGFKPR